MFTFSNVIFFYNQQEAPAIVGIGLEKLITRGNELETGDIIDYIADFWERTFCDLAQEMFRTLSVKYYKTLNTNTEEEYCLIALIELQEIVEANPKLLDNSTNKSLIWLILDAIRRWAISNTMDIIRPNPNISSPDGELRLILQSFNLRSKTFTAWIAIIFNFFMNSANTDQQHQLITQGWRFLSSGSEELDENQLVLCTHLLKNAHEPSIFNIFKQLLNMRDGDDIARVYKKLQSLRTVSSHSRSSVSSGRRSPLWTPKPTKPVTKSSMWQLPRRCIEFVKNFFSNLRPKKTSGVNHTH